MAKLSRRKRDQIISLKRIRIQKSKESRPIRIAIVMVGGKGEPITVEQEKIVDGWVEEGDWLEASNISLLYEQGHMLTEDQKDLYDAWQFAKRDIMRDRKKNRTYRRSSSYHTEMIANPETSRECPCCGLAYTVSRMHTSKWVKKCMMCEGVCTKKKGCKLIYRYKPYEPPENPFYDVYEHTTGNPLVDAFMDPPKKTIKTPCL